MIFFELKSMSLDAVKFLEDQLEGVGIRFGSCLYDYQLHAACICGFPSFAFRAFRRFLVL